MRQVSVVRFARKKAATIILGTMVATAGIQGIANAGQAREIAVSTLGGPNRFSGPMRGVDDLRAMATTNRTHITAVLGQAGIGDISTQVTNVLATGYISETTVSPGTHFEWMALKRSGRPGVLRNVRWTGRQAFDAFQFNVEANGYNYTFIVFALVSRTAVVAAAPPPAPAPPPPPREPEPAPEPPPVVQAPPPAPAPAVVVVEEGPSPHWTVAGFLGSSFSTGGDIALQTDAGDGGLTYGFQVGYMRRYLGAEVIADFAPTFKISSLALSDHPSVNSAMLNLVGKGYWGSEGQFQPYISGGLGWLTMRTSTFTLDGSTVFTAGDTTVVALNTVNNTQSKFATNIGGGFFAFANRWGVRGDIRYYHASTFETEKLTNNINDFTQALVSGLTYWRANLGVAYRW
jgi:hypothetical protein